MNKGDIIIALALLAVAGVLSLFRLSGGAGAIYVNGEPAASSATVNAVVVEVDGSRARVVSSPCRDKLCINAGWLEKPGEIAACLPQRVVVEIRSEKGGGVDGIAY